MGRDSIIIDGKAYNYTVYANGINIENSCGVKKKFFEATLIRMRELHPECAVWKRSTTSLIREWTVHNFLHSAGISCSQTADVDLDYPCDKPEWLYGILGALMWIFVK